MRWISADLPKRTDLSRICNISKDFAVDPQITDQLLESFQGKKDFFDFTSTGSVSAPSSLFYRSNWMILSLFAS